MVYVYRMHLIEIGITLAPYSPRKSPRPVDHHVSRPQRRGMLSVGVSLLALIIPQRPQPSIDIIVDEADQVMPPVSSNVM